MSRRRPADLPLPALPAGRNAARGPEDERIASELTARDTELVAQRVQNEHALAQVRQAVMSQLVVAPASACCSWSRLSWRRVSLASDRRLSDFFIVRSFR